MTDPLQAIRQKAQRKADAETCRATYFSGPCGPAEGTCIDCLETKRGPWMVEVCKLGGRIIDAGGTCECFAREDKSDGKA